MRHYTSFKDKVADTMIYMALIMLGVFTLVPFMQVITISLSPAKVVASYGIHLIPTQITFDGYRSVFTHDLIWISYMNTFIRTLIGVIISLLLYIVAAYPLSKKYLPHRKFWTLFFLFTLYFQGGLIPSYILIKDLHMMDTIWALVLPPAFSAYTLIIMRNFFMSLPEDLVESAKIDGANDVYILIKIIIPLSKPIIATVSLWSAVFHWNAWFDCLLFIQTKEKWTLQYVLRRILIDGAFEDLQFDFLQSKVNTDTMKMATLVAATFPILLVYPFLQKYFIQGMRMGAVKG